MKNISSMCKRDAFVNFISFIILSIVVGLSTTGFTNVKMQRNLRVSLYPYLPNSSDLYWKLETAFEKKFPDIELEISLAADDYYGSGPNSITQQQADVYEIDCVFLKDFISSGKIKPLPEKFQPLENDFLPMASIAKQNNQWYGYPHWVCGNFLFYNKNNISFKEVKNFKDIIRLIPQNPSINNGLLIDLTGSSTLGEMYLDGLMDKYKSFENASKYLNSENIDTNIVNNLNSLLNITYKRYGRIRNYHDRLGFYPRQFAKGNGVAYVGYSEQAYYMLTESLQSCTLEENCLKQENIEVTEWPLSTLGSQPIGWVDMFVVDSGISDQKLEDAHKFMQFMVSDSAYLKVLLPEFNESSRYLLPAKSSVYKNVDLLSVAPLYSKFYPIIYNAIPLTDAQLNNSLRSIGKDISDNRLLEKVEK